MSRRRIAALLALAAGILSLTIGCGGGDDVGAAGTTAPPLTSTTGATTSPEHDGHTTSAPAFEGGTVTPLKAAPALRLRDIDGRTVDLRDLRGRPVLVTFVYARCPDVCPLIMSSLQQVRARSGELGRSVRVVAVSVDPEGDTPAVVRNFLRTRRVDGFVDYLIGDRPTLERVWTRWAVALNVPRSSPELIEHSALIYGITSSGDLATAYPVGFDPAAIVRDLPRLAGS